MTALAFLAVGIACFLAGFIAGTVGWVWWATRMAQRALRIRETQTISAAYAARASGRVQ